MSHNNTSAGASETEHRQSQLARIWYWLVDGLAAIGTLLIGILMLIICTDVAARNLLGASLPLISELSALTLVMIVYLQLATTIRHDRLARTDIFFSSFKRNKPRAGALLGAIYDAAGALMIGTIAWSSIRILEKDYNSSEFIGVIGVATMPTWPFRVAILLGVTVAAIQLVFQVLNVFRTIASQTAEATK